MCYVFQTYYLVSFSIRANEVGTSLVLFLGKGKPGPPVAAGRRWQCLGPSHCIRMERPLHSLLCFSISEPIIDFWACLSPKDGRIRRISKWEPLSFLASYPLNIRLWEGGGTGQTGHAPRSPDLDIARDDVWPHAQESFLRFSEYTHTDTNLLLT